MTYKQAITDSMTALAADPSVVFIGYGVTRGKAMGTLANVNPAQLIEFPVAENLMVGAAIGMALRGRKPVVFIERADFLLNAMDAIVNHLCKIELMSAGQFKPAIMFRIVVGNTQKPLFTGETHTQNFSDSLVLMANDPAQPWFSCPTMRAPSDAPWLYTDAAERMRFGQSTAIFELKDLY